MITDSTFKQGNSSIIKEEEPLESVLNSLSKIKETAQQMASEVKEHNRYL